MIDLCAVLDRAFLIMELFKSAAELYLRKIVKLLHNHNFDVDVTRPKLKRGKSCSEYMRENHNGKLENKRVLRKEVCVQQRGSRCKSAL